MTDSHDRLTTLDHIPELPQSEDELRESIETEDKENQAKNKPDPRDEKEYTFHFKWKDGRGKVWEGDFTNKILSLRERQSVGVMRARMAGGMPFGSMDPLSTEINHMLTHMTVSLLKRPKWAENMLDFTNFELLQEIFMEVDSHESHFHGRQPIEDGGENQLREGDQ